MCESTSCYLTSKLTLDYPVCTHAIVIHQYYSITLPISISSFPFRFIILSADHLKQHKQCQCNGGWHKSFSPSSAPSSLPSSLPSQEPSVSSEPSSQPSVTLDSVLDGQSCQRNRDCNSGLCSVRLFYVLHFSDFFFFTLLTFFFFLSHSCWDSFK